MERFGMANPAEQMGPYLVWAFPYDPALKGLGQAAWGPAVQDALGGLGRRPRAVHVQPLRYRPRRRALFRYRVLHGDGIPTEVMFGKVLRTVRARSSIELANRLARRRRIVRRRQRHIVSLALPAGRLTDNILLFEPMAGRSLRDLLLGQDSLPEPRRVVEVTRQLTLLEPLVGDIESPRHSRSPRSTIASTAELLTCIVPDASSDIGEIREAIELAAEQDVVPRTVVHGDLYDAQVFVQDDYTLGLVDVDDLGLGDPALDAANFTTHLLALALARPGAKQRLMSYRTLVRQAFLAQLGIAPADLSWREALVMMQMATGPFRVLDTGWPERVTKQIRVARRLLHATD
jgi:hypothetical protein